MFKCCVCGRFVSYADLDSGRARVSSGVEACGWSVHEYQECYHADCDLRLEVDYIPGLIPALVKYPDQPRNTLGIGHAPFGFWCKVNGVPVPSSLVREQADVYFEPHTNRHVIRGPKKELAKWLPAEVFD